MGSHTPSLEREVEQLEAERDAEAMAADWFGLLSSYYGQLLADRIVGIEVEQALMALEQEGDERRAAAIRYWKARTERLEKAAREMVEVTKDLGEYYVGQEGLEGPSVDAYRVALKAMKEALEAERD